MTGMHVASFSNDPLGWIVWLSGAVVTAWTFYFAIHAFIAPGETNPDHPKNLILKDDR